MTKLYSRPRAFRLCAYALLMASIFAAIVAEASEGISGQAARAPMEKAVNVRVKDATVEAALSVLAKEAGISVELLGTPGQHKKSINLVEVPVTKAIHRILGKLDYVIVWNSDESLTILMLDELQRRLGAESSAQDPTQPINEVLDLGTGITPSAQSAEDIVTREDLAHDRSIWKTTDPRDVDLLPPSPRSEENYTIEEIEFFAANRNLVPIEVLPPDSQEAELINLGTLQEQGHESATPLDTIKAIPGDETALTLGEIKDSLNVSSEMSGSQLPLADLIPPTE